MMMPHGTILALSLFATASANYFSSAGSCYSMLSHIVTCDIAEDWCVSTDDEVKYWYEPGAVGQSGCCHCDADCDHTL